jgi:hypothetical protein|tara:strand:+ start:196 stop:474 length:279 start_codon:yes stop_codon:yes gene_type:complete
MADVKILNSRFDDFRGWVKKEFARMHETNRVVITSIDNIKENHLHAIDGKISKLENKMGNLRTEIAWLKKIQWMMLTSAISNLVGVIYLIIK